LNQVQVNYYIINHDNLSIRLFLPVRLTQ
jgi:hypothetical protein